MLHQLKVLFKLGFLQKRFGIRPSGRSAAFQTQPTWHKPAGDGEDLDGDTVAGEMVGDGGDLDGDGAMMAGDTVAGEVVGAVHGFHNWMKKRYLCKGMPS
jgi:hypothetical protein